MKRLLVVIVLCCCGVVIAGASNGLDSVKGEPNLEKRAKAALDYANTALDAARAAYDAGDNKKTLGLLDEIEQAADICRKALAATGKDAHRSPKAFKRAEMQTRELIRRLESFAQDVSVDDRPPVVATGQQLQQFHDDLISQILGKRK